MRSSSHELVEAPNSTFSEAYLGNVDRVFGFLAYRVQSKHQAEDLTQVVFEKALRAWHRFEPGKSSVTTWLMAIAKNVLVDDFRRRKETLMGDEEVHALLDHQSVAPPDASISPGLARALAGLKPKEQTVLALRFGGDLKGSEIGELLGMSTDNVHQILSRSLRRLRDTLEAPPQDA